MSRPETSQAAPENPGRVAAAVDLMTRFAARGRRYLWTDAFAVCNFLALDRLTGEGRFTELALRVVDDVHHTLGQHRSDDARRGWLAGAGEVHPTRGGLRIGKPLPERSAGQPIDERLEWERDGQYFHYLVKWMHALDQVARATAQPLFSTWARELAEVAHRAFTAGGRMIWKASIDLSRPLVPSMGQHDPLDGWVTCLELEATARALGATGPELAAAQADFAAMIDPAALVTGDPLGVGGLLADAFRLEQLAGSLAPAVLEAAVLGLRHAGRALDRRGPADRRLAFRELGLAIGVAAADLAMRRGPSAATAALWRQVAGHADLREEIESFWLDPVNRQSAGWRDHQDINDVMLATCLVPEGFLVLGTR